MSQDWRGARISEQVHQPLYKRDTHKSWSYAGDHVEGDQSNFGTYNDIGGNQTNNTNNYSDGYRFEDQATRAPSHSSPWSDSPVEKRGDLQSKGIRKAMQSLSQLEMQLNEELERAEKDLAQKQAEVNRMRLRQQMLREIKDELQKLV
ncbi:hypothetical protein CVT26_006819 [Gymnopilus dilepis]|uniref:Uncharacterized protein n=1 Tax=Gymnopilus dilepis TaxID=231916 RepID=A0A409VMZ4_9AGAR|nr:hypothetical protein CVT26_006819 [Gymnopilus dilepis]